MASIDPVVVSWLATFSTAALGIFTFLKKGSTGPSGADLESAVRAGEEAAGWEAASLKTDDPVSSPPQEPVPSAQSDPVASRPEEPVPSAQDDPAASRPEEPVTTTIPQDDPAVSLDNEITPGPLRILVAEDNAINRKVMELLLKRIGYRADQAVDGVEAVEMASAGSYDTILMDLHMPRMGGIQATEEILARLPQPHPQVVAVTADVTREAREACQRVGMCAYLTKPVDSEQLLFQLKQSEERRMAKFRRAS